MESILKLTQLDLFACLENRTVCFENARLLQYDNFKLYMSSANTACILGCGSNDDHYLGTIAGIDVKWFKRLTKI